METHLRPGYRRKQSINMNATLRLGHLPMQTQGNMIPGSPTASHSQSGANVSTFSQPCCPLPNTQASSWSPVAARPWKETLEGVRHVTPLSPDKRSGTRPSSVGGRTWRTPPCLPSVQRSFCLFLFWTSLFVGTKMVPQQALHCGHHEQI